MPPLDQSEFEILPVDVLTFVKEFQKEQPFPKQEDFLKAVFFFEPNDLKAKYEVLIALWGQGAGKDFTIKDAFAYLAYLLLCLKNPQKTLGLGRDEPIDLVNVSFNARQARDVFFKKFKNAIAHTINPETGQNWFEEQGMNIKASGSKGDIKQTNIDFPKNIRAHSLNSLDCSPEGLNVLMSCFDEVSRFPFDGIEGTGKAKELFDVLHGNATSRFGEYGRTLLLSYPDNDPNSDFLLWMIEKYQNDSKFFISKGATWEVNKLRQRSDFERHYQRDFRDAQCRFECQPTAGHRNIYQNPELIDKAEDTSIIPIVEWHAEKSDLTVDGKIGQYITVKIDVFRTDHKPRMIAADPGLSKSEFALLIGYAVPLKELDLPKEQAQKLESAGIFNQVVVDGLIRWQPQQKHPVSLLNVKQVIDHLASKLNIQGIYLDKWNSAYMVQDWLQSGFYAEALSFSADQQREFVYYTHLLLENGLIKFIPHRAITEGLKSARMQAGTPSSKSPHVFDAFQILATKLATLETDQKKKYRQFGGR